VRGIDDGARPSYRLRRSDSPHEESCRGVDLASVVWRKITPQRTRRAGSSVGVEDRSSLGGGGSSYSSHEEESSVGRAYKKGALKLVSTYA
jgi:hypothetical protein